MRSDNEGHSPLAAVCSSSDEVGRNSSAHIRRDSHELSIARRETHTLGDRRHRELETVVGGGVGPRHDSEKINLPVLEDRKQSALVESLLAVFARVGNSS